MRRFVVLIPCVMLLASLACNAPSNSGAGASGTVSAHPTEEPPSATLPQSTDAPTLTPTVQSTDPRFIGPVYFTTDQNASVGSSSFAEGVGEIWAVWDYANMRDGLTIRRLWMKDGEVWIDREEEWDFAKYGASGTMRDVSIYDRDIGLEAGSYELHLYIEGIEQEIAATEGPATFRITTGQVPVGEYPAPSGTKTISIEAPGTLMLSVCDECDPQMIAEHGEIIDVDWFPNERYVLYTVLDRAEQIADSSLGLKWELWIADLVTITTTRISEPGEAFHDPVIAPDNSMIAINSGNGYADAGFIASELAFITLSSFQRTGVIYSTSFAGIPANSEGTLYPESTHEYGFPGMWNSASEFIASMNTTGSFEGEFEPGIYSFNVQTRVATRIGDLIER